MQTRTQNLKWEQWDCYKEHELFDKRNPGLFKVEYNGSICITLILKTYFCSGKKEEKQVSKGLSTKLNKFNISTNLNVLKTRHSWVWVNKGLICRNNQLFTYTQKKAGLSFYGKRKVLEDNIITTLNSVF